MHRSKNGMLVVGRHTYSSVLVPPTLMLKESTAKVFSEFADGGKLIFVGTIPHLIDGEEGVYQFPGAVIASSLDEAIGMLGALYPNRVRVIDRHSGGNFGPA